MYINLSIKIRYKYLNSFFYEMGIEETLKLCKNKYTNEKCVVAIGKGEKRNKNVIIVMVSKKTAKIRNIPKKINDIEIEVKEVGKITAR